MKSQCTPSHLHVEVVLPGGSRGHSITAVRRSACCRGHGGWEAGAGGHEHLQAKHTPERRAMSGHGLGGLRHSPSEVLGANDGAPKCQPCPPWLFFPEGHCKDISHVSFYAHFLTLLLSNSAPGSVVNKQETVNSKSHMPLGWRWIHKHDVFFNLCR